MLSYVYDINIKVMALPLKLFVRAFFLSGTLARSVVIVFLAHLLSHDLPLHQRSQCILFSVVFTPPPPIQHQCLASTCHLSTLSYHCIAGTGLPIRMNGEVSWEPRPLSLQSSLPSSHRPLHPLPSKREVHSSYLCWKF
jgi:hypothetical protein